jgi:hypothetical protein
VNVEEEYHEVVSDGPNRPTGQLPPSAKGTGRDAPVLAREAIEAAAAARRDRGGS